PFPRPDRNDPRTAHLKRLQGWWVEVSFNGRPSKTKTEVRGDVWNHDSPGDRWRITLDPQATPHRIDLVGIAPQSGHFRGIYKFEGETFTDSLHLHWGEADRPQ